jgi:uncharacterized protein (DUF302 family)
MPATLRNLSISVRTAASYQRTLPALREALKRHGFEILCECPVDQELVRKVGLSWEHLRLPWQHYTVFVVWSPFDAWPALLSDRDGGLLIPFNLCAVDDGRSTFVAMINHCGVMGSNGQSIGVQVLVRDLTRRAHEVLMEIAVQ